MNHSPGAHYHTPSRMVPRCCVAVDIRPRPTTAEAKAALRRIRKVMGAVAWADGERAINEQGFEETDLDAPPGLDEASGLLALMTCVCRPSLELAPAFAAIAAALSGSGVGKTYLIEIISLLAFGRPPQVVSLGRDEAEQEKRLIGAYLEGSPVLLFDNMNGQTFRCDPLASLITTGSFRVRKLGGSDTFAVNSRAMAFFTGNDFKFGEDLIRRGIVIKLDARLENPESRRLPRGVLADVLAQRGKYLSDVLTVWRWGRQNRRDLPRGRPLAGFEAWAEWCRDPLLALGCPDPLSRLDETRFADPYRARTMAILAAWWAAHGNTLISAFDLAESVLVCIHPEKRSRQYVAPQVSKLVGTRVGGFVLDAFPPTVRSDPVMYRLKKTNEAPVGSVVEGVL